MLNATMPFKIRKFEHILNSNPGSIAMIIAVTLAGAVWLVHKGPIAVIRGTTALDEIVPFWYMLTAFPVLGMLVAELLASFSKHRPGRATILLFSQIIMLVLISNIRLSLKIPISGHAFLFSFFIFHRIFAKAVNTAFQKAELATVSAFILIIGYIKLAWWNDPLTLFAGIFAGLALASLTMMANFKCSRE